MPKMKEYAAFAATKNGKMVQVATTEAATEEEAAMLLNRLAWATGIEEMEIKETKNRKETK